MILPERTKIYDNHIFNSLAWDHYQHRVEDIIITTSLKSGTTWMQAIVENLIFQNKTMPDVPWRLSPWLDHRRMSVEESSALLESQTHRRCIKTHLPLNALPYFSTAKYIYVGRNVLDIFMSFWNHYRHIKPERFEKYNEFLSSRNEVVTPCSDNIHDFFSDWISKSMFPWENEGFPFWSPLYHLNSWWEYQHLPNILFVHYNDLLMDLHGEIRRIANYLGIEIDESAWKGMVESLTFKHMQNNAEQFVLKEGDFLEGGAKRFLYKGTNGRWRGVLTQEELAQYDHAVSQQLKADCSHWMKNGLRD